jgi:hypothetical protein
MWITLDIDDYVLATVKEIARREHLSAGQVISRLARLALTSRADQPAAALSVGEVSPVSESVLVSNEFVNTLRDAEGV